MGRLYEHKSASCAEALFCGLPQRKHVKGFGRAHYTTHCASTRYQNCLNRIAKWSLQVLPIASSSSGNAQGPQRCRVGGSMQKKSRPYLSQMATDETLVDPPFTTLRSYPGGVRTCQLTDRRRAVGRPLSMLQSDRLNQVSQTWAVERPYRER